MNECIICLETTKPIYNINNIPNIGKQCECNYFCHFQCIKNWIYDSPTCLVCFKLIYLIDSPILNNDLRSPLIRDNNIYVQTPPHYPISMQLAAVTESPLVAPPLVAPPSVAPPSVAPPSVAPPLVAPPLVAPPMQEYIAPMQEYIAPMQEYIAPMQEYEAPPSYYIITQNTCAPNQSSEDERVDDINSDGFEEREYFLNYANYFWFSIIGLLFILTVVIIIITY